MEQTHDIEQIAAQVAHGMTLETLREGQDKRAQGRRYIHDEGPEARERLQQYAAQVYAPRPVNALNIVRRTKQEMSYDDARLHFWRVLIRRAAELSVITGTDFVFQFSDEQAAVIRGLLQYFINDPACPYPLNKGVYLYGLRGCGKTEIMQALSTFTTEQKLSKAFAFSDLADIYAGARANKNTDPITPMLLSDRCFDELGYEVGAVLLYGDPLDINESIIYQRYEKNRKHGQLTHFVSNHKSGGLAALFSERIMSRMKDLVYSIHYPGEDLRGN